MKHTKFIIGSNPLVAGGVEYVAHLRNPIIIAQVHIFNDVLAAGEYMHQVDVGGSTEVAGQHWVLEAIVYDPRHDADELAKVMRRMSDWLRSVKLQFFE